MKLAMDITLSSTMAVLLVLSMTARTAQAAAAAPYTPMYVLNNGKLEAAKFCSTSEWSKIEAAFVAALSGSNSSRRMLRRDLSATKPPLTLVRNCAGNLQCLSAVHGCATIPTVTNVTENNRLCAVGISAVDAAFTKLKSSATPSLSMGCQALLDAPRKVTCVENVVDCDVVDFTVIKPTNGTNSSSYTAVSKLNVQGGSVICNKQRDSLTVLANTKFDLGALVLELWSDTIPAIGEASYHRNRTDTARPYVVHNESPPTRPAALGGNRTRIVPYFASEVLSGSYVMRAYLPSDPTGGKNVRFSVKTAC